jgi:hypothetical protein
MEHRDAWIGKEQAERRLAVGPACEQPRPGTCRIAARNRRAGSRPRHSNGIGGMVNNPSSVSSATMPSKKFISSLACSSSGFW